MLIHLPVYKDSIVIQHFFFMRGTKIKFFRVLHLDHSMAESGSQPGHLAQQPSNTEQEKAWGSANLMPGSHSDMTSSVASSLPVASRASQYSSKGRNLTKGRAGYKKGVIQGC